jgi:hypothetical protein
MKTRLNPKTKLVEMVMTPEEYHTLLNITIDFEFSSEYNDLNEKTRSEYDNILNELDCIEVEDADLDLL